MLEIGKQIQFISQLIDFNLKIIEFLIVFYFYNNVPNIESLKSV